MMHRDDCKRFMAASPDPVAAEASGARERDVERGDAAPMPLIAARKAAGSRAAGDRGEG